MSAVDRILERLEGVKRSGSGWMAKCPAHDDRTASLKIDQGDDCALVHCHANCSSESVAAALGLRLADLYDEPSEQRRDQPEAVYDYVDEQGELLFQVCRFRDKRFLQRRPDGSGGHVWKLDDTRRVLYRLPLVLSALEAGYPIWIAEGEKDVHALEEAGVVATTNPGGAGKWRDEYADTIAGAEEIVVVADQDEAGRAHVEQVKESLAGRVGSIRIVAPKAGKDAADHLDAGHRLDEFVPIDGAAEDIAELLNDVVVFVRRFVVMTDAQAAATALWTLHTWAIDAAETTPYLHVRSPLKKSGKSRGLEVLDLLVNKPVKTANATPAAIFRTIGEQTPSLLWDEVDAVFGPKARDNEDLRALLNAGYRRGTPVLRCVGEGSKQEVKPFEVFCPKVLAGIGRLPDTIEDRSLPIALKRRTRDEHVERFREKRVREQAAPLRERMQRWAAQSMDALAEAEPDLPDALDDRAQDVCEPLLAIADRAGEKWALRARQALVELRTETVAVDDSVKVQLLADIRTILEKARADRIFSVTLVTELAALEESPWGEWGRSSKPITQNALAGLLRDFDIHSKQIRIDETTKKGYTRGQFEDAWKRWAPETASETKQRNIGSTIRKTGDSEAKQAESVFRPENGANPYEQRDVSVFRFESPKQGVGHDRVLCDRLRAALPDNEVRRLLEAHRPELIGRNDITTPDERREIAALEFQLERMAADKRAA